MRTAMQQRLVELARESIQRGLMTGRPLQPDPRTDEAELLEPGASFVTLEIKRELRGCIGTLEPGRPLLIDVSENAFRAAFRDPRFPPLHHDEYRVLSVQVSVLNLPEPMAVESEADLVRQLQPGVDGLTLSDGERRATFLPSVWEQLNDAHEFVLHLKRKGGWSLDYWGPEIIAERYTVESFRG